MIILIPVDDETTACIAWGRVKGMMDGPDMSPVTHYTFPKGGGKYTFRMNLSSKKVSLPGRKTQWETKVGRVTVWNHEYDKRVDKLTDVLKLLRGGDIVLVFGRYEEEKYTDRQGAEQIGININADIVIPAAWVYDIMLALFAQVIVKAPPPVSKKVNLGRPPKEKKMSSEPQISHPVVIENDEGVLFE